MAFGQDASLMVGVIGPMALLGLSFAVLVAPLTASVMSSVTQYDEELASGINNAASRIAQLVRVAAAAGGASSDPGYEIGLADAATGFGRPRDGVGTTGSGRGEIAGGGILK